MAGFIHDMALMENLLMESKLCYTVVRPPGLSNGELLPLAWHRKCRALPCKVEAGGLMVTNGY